MTSVDGVYIFGNAKGEPFTSQENASRSLAMRKRKGMPIGASLTIREIRP
jgi:hypothetical protein